MPYDPPPALSSLNLDEIAALADAKNLPPVADWNPEKSGDSEMQIAADGRWYHQDGEIKRPAMIRAFSRLLRRDPGGSYWLVTPQEKLRIEVEDVPFQAVEMQVEGIGNNQRIGLRLNSDELLVIDSQHQVEMRGSVPYVHVRAGLWARISRAVYYELAELLLNDENKMTLSSCGFEFNLGPIT